MRKLVQWRHSDMAAMVKSGRLWLAAGIVLCFCFAGITSFVLYRDKIENERQFANHAAILSVDVWAMDISGVSSYLSLVTRINHYKKLLVVEPDGSLFAGGGKGVLTGVDGYFHQAGLIPTRELTSPITYEGREIGILKGEQYVRVIFPLLNILTFFLFICLLLTFIGYLASHRRQLQHSVAEKTVSLQESEARFHDLVNLLPEMIWESDRYGNIRYANQAAIDRFGLRTLEQENLVWFDLIAGQYQDQVKRSFAAIIGGEDQGLEEYRAIDSEGKLFPVLIRSSAIRRDGTIVGTRTIVIDISERYELEKELHRAQKMKAIGMMAGGVAHDLNNILSSLVSYPEILLMQLPEKSELRPPIEAIKQSGLQAAEVVYDLLTVARGVSAKKEVHAVNNLLEEYLASPEFIGLQEISHGIAFYISLGEDAGNILCSPVHFKKCVMNLVANSVEAIAASGCVAIRTGSAAGIVSPTGDGLKKPGNYAVVSVEDNGAGLTPEDTERIFEPFYTRKKMGRSGTGLGLTIVWNTMVDHNGWVEVNSGGGRTVFSLYFPQTGEDVVEKPSQIDWPSLKGNNQCVLVIDDEVRQRDIAAQLLQILGYQPKCVASGEEAITLLEKESADILLLDMIMDPGMNGLETYRRICEMHPGQKAVIATGYSKSTEVEETLRLGASTYITKPYTIDQLAQALARAFTCN